MEQEQQHSAAALVLNKPAKAYIVLRSTFFNSVHLLIRCFEDASDGEEDSGGGVKGVANKGHTVEQSMPTSRFGDSIHAMMKKDMGQRKAAAVRSNIMEHGTSIVPN